MSTPKKGTDLSDVTCNRCGRVHREVSRETAEAQVENYNKHLRGLEPKDRKKWPEKPAEVSDYESCDGCGAFYLDFRDAKPGDCPVGATLGAIISRTE